MFLALSINGRKILMAATLGVAVVYLYAVFAYVNFRDDMVLDNGITIHEGVEVSI